MEQGFLSYYLLPVLILLLTPTTGLYYTTTSSLYFKDKMIFLSPQTAFVSFCNQYRSVYEGGDTSRHVIFRRRRKKIIVNLKALP